MTPQDRPPKHPPPWFVHIAWRVHRALYRFSGGRFLWTTSNKRGWGSLHLTTVGRKSGQERSVIIGYLEDGPKVANADRLPTGHLQQPCRGSTRSSSRVDGVARTRSKKFQLAHTVRCTE